MNSSDIAIIISIVSVLLNLFLFWWRERPRLLCYLDYYGDTLDLVLLNDGNFSAESIEVEVYLDDKKILSDKLNIIIPKEERHWALRHAGVNRLLYLQEIKKSHSQIKAVWSWKYLNKDTQIFDLQKEANQSLLPESVAKNKKMREN